MALPEKAPHAQLLFPILCVPVEESPKAIPYGAARIVSAIKSALALTDKVKTFLIEKALHETAQQFANRCLDSISEQKKHLDIQGVVVGFSFYVWNKVQLIESARILKLAMPELIFIAGGPELSANPESFRKLNLFDYLQSGESEEDIVAFFTELLRCDIEYHNAAYNNKESNKSPLAVDLAKQSSPYLDGTLDCKLYGGALWELGRGCPFKCSYCFESRGEKKLRKASTQMVEAELKHFIECKIPYVFVLDPSFNANNDYCVQILNILKKSKTTIHFDFEIKAEHITQVQAELFSSLNCSLQIGLQSANARILKTVRRNFDKETFKQKIKILDHHGLIFGFDLMFGLPGDSLEFFKQTLDFAIGLRPNHLDIFKLAVLPGTELHNEAASLGLICQAEAPYLVQSQASFSANDLSQAQEIAVACSLFYSRGRAVSWFLAILKLLKTKPADFFNDFSHYLKASLRTIDKLSLDEVASLQIAFCQKAFHNVSPEDKKTPLFIEDLIGFNLAYSKALIEGQSSKIVLSYQAEIFESIECNNIQACVSRYKPSRYQVTIKPDSR